VRWGRDEVFDLVSRGGIGIGTTSMRPNFKWIIGGAVMGRGPFTRDPKREEKKLARTIVGSGPFVPGGLSVHGEGRNSPHRGREKPLTSRPCPGKA